MTDLPERVVVGANGAYWRDYGDHYSMAVVSEDNDPVNPVTVYVPETRRTFIDGLAERALTPTGDHHVVPGGYCLDCQGQHMWDSPSDGLNTTVVTDVMVEAVSEALHQLAGTQHYITHETGYDGDEMEGWSCIGGPSGHSDDALDLIAELAERGYMVALRVALEATGEGSDPERFDRLVDEAKLRTNAELAAQYVDLRTAVELADTRTERLRALLADMAPAFHATESVRDHADPTDKTGWHVKGIETCADALCVEAVRLVPALRVALDATGEGSGTK